MQQKPPGESIWARQLRNFSQATALPCLYKKTDATDDDREPPMEPPRRSPETYRARLRRVLDYIDTHLDDALDVATLADVSAFSHFHFHRQFSAAYGLGAGRYVLLRRLKRAAYRLAFRTETPVLEIALDCGYEGPEAFARAFKRITGQTPSDFRAKPDWSAWHRAYDPVKQARDRVDLQRKDKMTETRHDPATAETTRQRAEVEIIDTAETCIACMEHHGDPAMIGDTIRRFIAWRKTMGLPPSRYPTYNIFHDDPDATPPDDFRLDICLATTSDLTDRTAGILMKTLPAGRCARLRITGSDETLAAGALFLYRDWLPQSGEELRDFPLYCHRIRFFPDVAEHAAETDLFLPLR